MTVEFDIREVAAMHSLTVRKGGQSAPEMVCDCPFCGAKAKLFLTYTKDGKVINKGHCMKCGWGGNVVTFYADLAGLSDYKAARKEMVERFFGKSDTVRSPKAKPAGKSAEPVKMDIAACDKAYRGLLKALRLAPEHLEHLVSPKRGLTKDQVSIFRTSRCDDPEAICRKLMCDGISLKGVPGFFIGKNGNWQVNFWEGNSGILIPCPDMDGRIAGMQILLDHPKNGMKYGWFTSANKKGGCAAKAHIAVYRGTVRPKSIFLCEGCLKAYIVHCLTGYTVVGFTGISCTKMLPGVLKRFRKEGVKNARIATDMDCFLSAVCHEDYGDKCESCLLTGLADGYDCPRKLRKRRDLQKARNKIIAMVKAAGLNAIPVYWDFVKKKDGTLLWLGNKKGPDDFLLAELKKNKKEVKKNGRRLRNQPPSAEVAGIYDQINENWHQ